MNPALPVVLALAVAPWFFRRGPWTRAWLAAGLAASLLLSPTLLLPDGIPSPAASLGKSAPWQGALDPAAGNATLVDVTSQIQPWQIFLRRQIRSGEAPFWNPHQFSGAPFWANGQSAPLFPLHLLFVVLPLQLGFVLLPWLRVVVAGVGSWALARELGVSSRSALVAGVVYPLSGMVSAFLLFPMANALCLVPWVLRAVERLASGKGRWSTLALLAGLQALGGHPGTFAHTALLGGLYLLLQPRRRVRSLMSAAGAWLVAAALAGIQLVPMVANLLQSSRWQEWTPSVPISWQMIGQLTLRLGLPHSWGHPAEGTWWGPFNYNGTAVFAGLLALPLAWVGFRDRAGEPRWRALCLLGLFCLLAAFQVPGLRDLLQALPVSRSLLYHRLLFAVDLGLGLLAAAGLDAWTRGARRATFEGSCLTAILFAAAWVTLAPEWTSRDLVMGQAAWTGWGLVVAALLIAGSAATADRRRGFAVAVPWVAVAELVAAHAGVNPVLDMARFYPETPGIRFLQDRPGRIAALGDALRPNAALVYGLDDVRGDDTLKLSHYEELYRGFGQASPYYFRPVVRWRHPGLDRLGVRWVMTPPGTRRPWFDGPPVYSGEDAWIYERATAWPLVRWRDAPAGGPRDAGIRVVRRGTGAWDVEWRRPGGGRIVIAETWDAGWQAEVAGESRPVHRVDIALMAVDVDGKAGEVRLRYRPVGLAWGAAASVAGLLAVLAGRPGRGGRCPYSSAWSWWSSSRWR